jgi:AraC family transcriptional regulator
VKYRKNGKSLCTLYPKQGYFVALINISDKESVEADLLIPACDEYTHEIYNKTQSGTYGKSLALEVTSQSILHDVKNLIVLRACSRKHNRQGN